MRIPHRHPVYNFSDFFSERFPVYNDKAGPVCLPMATLSVNRQFKDKQQEQGQTVIPPKNCRIEIYLGQAFDSGPCRHITHT